MRLKDFRLIRYGHFEGTTLEFGDCRGGLHIILGANEAGKSTSLRAVRSLLFGFHPQCPDNFRFPYNLLRVGATLEKADGSSQLFVRRKGNVGTLQDAYGASLPDSLLVSFLSGVDQKVYDRLYCLDHANVRMGGEDLHDGEGDLAEALFSAGSGVTHLQAVLKQLDMEADRLYKPEGRRSDPVIVAATERYRQLTEKARGLAVPTDTWVRLQEQLTERNRQHQELLDELSSQLRELERLRRIDRCIRLTARRRPLIREMAEIGDVPELPPEAREVREEAERQWNLELTIGKRLDHDIEVEQKALERSGDASALLERQQDLDDLAIHLGEYLADVRDLPKRTEAARQHEIAVRQGLRKLQPDATLTDVDSFRLPASARTEILRLATEHATRAERLRLLEASCDSAAYELSECQPHVLSGDDLPDITQLQLLVEKALADGDIDGRLDELSAVAEARERTLNRKLMALAHWAVAQEDIASLPAPSVEEVTLFEKHFTDISRETDRTERTCERVRAEIAKQQLAFGSLTASGLVTSERELSDTRERRELGWRLVRRSWLESPPSEEELEGFCGGATLDEAYVAAVRRADETGDRLRLHADRIAQATSIENRLQSLREELSLAETDYEDVNARREALQTRWLALWKGSGVEPGEPAEMRTWLGVLSEVRRDLAELESAQEELERLNRRMGKIGRLLSGQMEAIGRSPQQAGEPASLFVKRCRAAIEEIQDASRERAERVRQRAALESSLGRRKDELARATGSLDDWERDWRKAVDGWPWISTASPESASSILSSVDQLFNNLNLLDEKQHQIRGIEAAIRDFDQRVATLCAELAPELNDLPAAHAAQQLVQRLREARDRETQRALHARNLRRLIDERSRRASSWREVSSRILALQQAAGCDSVEDLKIIEQRSERVRILRASLEEIDAELTEESAGSTLEALIVEVESWDPDELRARIEEVVRRIQTLDDQRSPVAKELGALEQELAQIDGSDAAAAAMEEAQGALAEARNAVDRYMRLRLAAKVMRAAIDRYRESHQARLLDRAQQLFLAMTGGAFERLEVAFEDVKPALRALRGDERVPVSGLSDGTRDQLYLALRLASVEQQIASSPEPLPFIVDDILVNFDDERSRSTLRILAEMAERTQVLFFTHHARMKDLASELDIPGRIVHHDLSACAK